MVILRAVVHSIMDFFHCLCGPETTQRRRILVLSVFLIFLIDLWPLFHCTLWALKIEFYHLVVYSTSLIIISLVFSSKFSEVFRLFGRYLKKCILSPKLTLTLFCTMHLSIAVFLSFFVLDCIPHTSDGVFYLFQAKTFSSGHLALATPKYGPFLAMNQILMHEGRWFSMYPPGWPALLMVGVFIGKPWLINALLSTALVFVIYLSGREMYGERVGLLAALLAMPSPFLMVLATSFYSHISCALFCTIYLLCVLKAVKNDNFRWYMLAGGSLAVAFLIRPYTGVVFGTPGVVFLLYLLILKRRSAAIGRAILLAAPIIMAVCVLMGYNLKTAGDPLKLGYNLRFGTLNSPGFGERIDRDNAGDDSFTGEFVPTTLRHTPWRGLMILQSNWAYINYFLFGWPIPSLIFLMSWFLSCGPSKREKIVLSSIGALVFGYFLWHARTPGRVMTESLPWIIVMTARSIEQCHEKCKSGVVNRTGILSVVTICVLYTVVVFYPLNLIPSLQSRGWLNTNLPNLVKEKGIRNAVIFIDSESGERNMVSGFVPHQSYLWNELRPEKGDVVYLRDLGSRNAEIIKMEPDKTFWRYSYNDKTKRAELSDIKTHVRREKP